MFTIGDFAPHGRVSVRMLRHYDATGLLRPAHVDPHNGYRHYTAAQLARLNRIIALKDLGFTLQQVHDIVDEKIAAEELRGMLRLRQADLESAVGGSASRRRARAGRETSAHLRPGEPDACREEEGRPTGRRGVTEV